MSVAMALEAFLPLLALEADEDVRAPKADETSMLSGDSLQHLGEVEVYGKRPLATSQKLSGVDLQALSTTSVADALKYFSGVQIKDYGGLGGLKTINVRSMGAQHVGIYIDGILRLVSRTDEQWTELLGRCFRIERLDHFAWPGEETERRRLFYLRI